MSAEPEEARTLERFGELCDRAAQYDLQVNLEFAVYTGVRTLAHAADDGGAIEARQCLGADRRACTSAGRADCPAHIAQIDPSLFRYAQICDAGPDMPGPTDTPDLVREARTGRLLPGEGVLPLKDLVAALPPDLPLAIEAPCRATATLSALERAKRAYRALTTSREPDAIPQPSGARRTRPAASRSAG